MKARESRLNNLLEIRNQKFVIPVFQRKYSWTEKQCQTLWDDILSLSERGADAGHFIGSIVCYQVNDEEMPATDIRGLAYSEGISKNTLDRASRRKKLGETTQKVLGEGLGEKMCNIV